MVEPTQTTIIAGAIGTAAVGLVNWMFKRQVKRIDTVTDRVTELEKTMCTKGDLTDFGDRLENTITNGNSELKEAISDNRKRIDGLYSDMSKK